MLLRTTSDHPGFIALTQELTKFLAILDGDDHEFFHAQNSLDTIPNAVVIEEEGEPIACGAIRFKSETTAEIKRMYVKPEARGKGYSKQVLNELEAWAKELGAEETILETSRELKTAISLYESNGYRPIPNYPPYEDVETSRCFRKSLT